MPNPFLKGEYLIEVHFKLDPKGYKLVHKLNKLDWTIEPMDWSVNQCETAINNRHRILHEETKRRK